MKFKILNILIAVLLLSTAIYTFFVFLPNTREEVVNTQVYAVTQPAESKEEIEDEVSVNPIGKALNLVDGNTNVVEFKLLNRDIPKHWDGKSISLKYVYLGEYTENTIQQLNDLLLGEYKWQKQLDKDRNIVLSGPIFLKDNVYQLHTHNGLSFTQRQYLFGDLLHLLYSENQLKGTQIQLGSTTLEAIWTKDTHVLEDNTTPSGAQLIISTCLERNGDRRLISGWVIVGPQEL